MTMIKQLDDKMQLPNELQNAFNDLQILKYLRQAGIKKNFGFSCSYLLKLVFCLVFQQRNWFRLLESNHSQELPGKDTVYRFLNHPGFAWRRFLNLLSCDIVRRLGALTSPTRVKVLIVDDSMYDRNRSKAVELLARFKDHATGNFYKGFRLLTLGWSDGHSFVPLDFSLLSSKNSQVQGIRVNQDKRTHGFKRRLEALQTAPSLVPELLDRALKSGIMASYVLMDSWFTHACLLLEIKERGLEAIGMVKNTSQRYRFLGNLLTLKELYQVAKPYKQGSKNILRAIETTLEPGLTVKVVFVRHHTKKQQWLAILSTNCRLDPEEILRIYSMRWNIETFFKCTKSLLRLQKEFQGRSYDMMISHTTIVFARYILLSWQHRQSSDDRTFGGLFFALCDEVADLDWQDALQQLLQILDDLSKHVSNALSSLIKKQLYNWISALPSYIKLCLPLSLCES